MSEKRQSRRKQLDASHQRNWLTGRHAVTEMLRAGTWPFTRLIGTEETLGDLADVLAQVAEWPGVSSVVEPVSADRLTELCGSRHHQGVAAQMAPFPYQSLEDLPTLHEKRTGNLPPLIVICDRIQDGHNLGAILRSCDAMAVDAVIIGNHQQIGIVPQVARSSAGAVNHLPIVRVDNLAAAANSVAELGLQLLAASEKSTTPIWEIDAQQPTALIIGSETHGIDDELLALCSQQVVIPMRGQVESLNAAVAVGMVLYELRRNA